MKKLRNEEQERKNMSAYTKKHLWTFTSTSLWTSVLLQTANFFLVHICDLLLSIYLNFFLRQKILASIFLTYKMEDKQTHWEKHMVDRTLFPRCPHTYTSCWIFFDVIFQIQADKKPMKQHTLWPFSAK